MKDVNNCSCYSILHVIVVDVNCGPVYNVLQNLSDFTLGGYLSKERMTNSASMMEGVSCTIHRVVTQDSS